jgi:hypothetical protein
MAIQNEKAEAMNIPPAPIRSHALDPSMSDGLALDRHDGVGPRVFSAVA